MLTHLNIPNNGIIVFPSQKAKQAYCDQELEYTQEKELLKYQNNFVKGSQAYLYDEILRRRESFFGLVWLQKRELLTDTSIQV